MRVKIGVIPGQWAWEGGGESFLTFVERCEEWGWDSLWLSDRLVSDQMNLEPVTALAAAAARTKTMKFGTSVLALAIRNPVMLAKELATVDYLSGGRLLPAVGLGGDDEREYEATGGSKKERAGRTDEAIGLMRRLWTEDHVTHHGRYFQLSDVSIRPRPLFKPHPPMWIGGRTEYAWRRVAAVGDGWLTSSVTPPEAAAGINGIKAELAVNGR
ncbi:MAG: TIGR03619 family F420-dependent LLM class oxidoreductase, partial [Chloroflexota bacterium]